MIVKLPNEVKDISSFVGAHRHSVFLTDRPNDQKVSYVYEYNLEKHKDPAIKFNEYIPNDGPIPHPKFYYIKDPYPPPLLDDSVPPPFVPYACPISSAHKEMAAVRMVVATALAAPPLQTEISQASTSRATLDNIPQRNEAPDARKLREIEAFHQNVTAIVDPRLAYRAQYLEKKVDDFSNITPVKKVDPYEEEQSLRSSSSVKDEANDFLSSIFPSVKEEPSPSVITQDMEDTVSLTPEVGIEYEPSAELLAAFSMLVDDPPEAPHVQVKPEPVDIEIPEYKPSAELLASFATLSSEPSDAADGRVNVKEEQDVQIKVKAEPMDDHSFALSFNEPPSMKFAKKHTYLGQEHRPCSLDPIQIKSEPEEHYTEPHTTRTYPRNSQVGPTRDPRIRQRNTTPVILVKREGDHADRVDIIVACYTHDPGPRNRCWAQEGDFGSLQLDSQPSPSDFSFALSSAFAHHQPVSDEIRIFPPSAPHQEILQEILDLIFTQVYHAYPGRPSRNDLISLALTCHYFSETALDILWHTQQNLVPLIKTLPSHCWNERPSDGFERMFALSEDKPTDDEFRRFASYARRIRRINYLPYPFHLERMPQGTHRRSHNFALHGVSAFNWESYPLDLTALRSIWEDRQNKSITLFPSLLRLEFVNISHARKCLDIFLQTKGISVSLQWSDSHENITSLFPTIERYALSMQELDLGPLQEFQKENCTHLSRLVSQMTDLRRLSCASRILDLPAIQHLASLAHVQLGSSFPELHRLIMPEVDFANFVGLLNNLRPLQLQEISIYIPKVLPKADLRDAFEALQHGSSALSNVHRIIFKHTPPFNYRMRRGTDSDVFPTIYIQAFTLKPLLSFRHLSVLELDVPCRIDLGDNDFMAMADAWSYLKRLQLGSLGEWNSIHMITYDGFLYFLRQCRGLEYLSFSFNAGSEIPTLSQIPPECINQRITYLYVGDSDIGANTPESVAKFFAQVFPKLCGIGGKWLAQSPILGGVSRNQWDDVAKALVTFR
ncbi:hypothetical protein CPB84DRAFT_1846592 [Gymnopilus junonius]|uniref:F-box domain-containing protein n=1 Tax=Gymnopilus junonius TaxID=109634 RepID=A0A9P5NP83_GYMJU|nr:hypothetical protein CPB84DRAFT_1846592 [Gymnopilus junonius]